MTPSTLQFGTGQFVCRKSGQRSTLLSGPARLFSKLCPTHSGPKDYRNAFASRERFIHGSEIFHAVPRTVIPADIAQHRTLRNIVIKQYPCLNNVMYAIGYTSKVCLTDETHSFMGLASRLKHAA